MSKSPVACCCGGVSEKWCYNHELNMKRENEDNPEGEQQQQQLQEDTDSKDQKPPVKRPRSDEEEVRLLIPSKMAGAIIGKGGHNIQKLRTEFQAQVNVGDCTGPERVITIGADMETVTKVVKDIMKHLDKAGENEYELRILVHQSLAGCVIGRGGTKIKELKDQIGCRLKIFSNIAPQSTDRIAQVVGTEDQCLKALNDIIGLIKGTPIKGPVHNYDPHNYDDVYSDEYGGYGAGGGSGAAGAAGGGAPGGAGAGFGRNGRNSGGGAGGFDRRERFDDRRGGAAGGNGAGRGYDRGNDRRGGAGAAGGGSGMREREFINPWAPNVNGGQMGAGSYAGGNGLGMGAMGAMGAAGNMPAMNNMSNMGNGNMAGAFGGNNGNMDNKTSTQVTIPKDLAGAIIGKGGGRIRRIRNESNAFIQIDEALPGSTDRIITITGTTKEIQAAQYMLQQSVRENLASGGGGSGGGGGFNRN